MTAQRSGLYAARNCSAWAASYSARAPSSVSGDTVDIRLAAAAAAVRIIGVMAQRRVASLGLRQEGVPLVAPDKPRVTRHPAVVEVRAQGADDVLLRRLAIDATRSRPHGHAPARQAPSNETATMRTATALPSREWTAARSGSSAAASSRASIYLGVPCCRFLRLSKTRFLVHWLTGCVHHHNIRRSRAPFFVDLCLRRDGVAPTGAPSPTQDFRLEASGSSTAQPCAVVASCGATARDRARAGSTYTQ